MKGIILITVFIFSGILQSYSQKSINVSDFGAKGNGLNDDTEAFLNCFKEAVKHKNSIITVPYGNYRITKPLDIFYAENSLTIKGISKNGKKPIIFTKSNMTLISLRGYAFKENSKGSATIENLKLIGGNVAYSTKHPLINKGKFYYGIYIADKNTAIINDVDISNIYGEGIGIINTDPTMGGSGRFQFISIKNSKITNCWGYNPSIDDYGDGIYVANVQKGEIINNVINNNINVTRQFGRGGIVLEWFADNILVQNNQVKGYDRGLHIEGTTGGQQILNNVFSGSDLGIVLYEYPIAGYNNKPIIIKGNVVSNEGFNKNLKVNRVRKPRSMINFLAKDNCRAGSQIEGNTFIIDGRFQFDGTEIANILSDNLTFKGNVFSIINTQSLSKKIKFNDSGTKNKFINNTTKGIILKNQ